MEKFDACERLSRKLRLFGDTWEPYHKILVHQHYIGKTTQVVFIFLKLKYLLLELNTWTLLSVFYKNNLTMISLFQNMRSIVSCRQICAPNLVQVWLSVRVLNGWLDSDYIQPVIQNTISPWDYMILLWNKRIITSYYRENIPQSHIKLNKSVLRGQMSSMQQQYHWRYYVNLLISKYMSCNWQSMRAIDGTKIRKFIISE